MITTDCNLWWNQGLWQNSKVNWNLTLKNAAKKVIQAKIKNKNGESMNDYAVDKSLKPIAGLYLIQLWQSVLIGVKKSSFILQKVARLKFTEKLKKLQIFFSYVTLLFKMDEKANLFAKWLNCLNFYFHPISCTFNKRNHGTPLFLFIVESDLTPSLSGVKVIEVVKMNGMM